MEQVLQNSAGLDETTGAVEALEILQQLDSFLSSFVDESKADQIVAAIFPTSDDRGGILKYLQSHIAIKSHEKARVEAFKVIQKFLDDPRFKVPIVQVCLQLYTICSLIWKNQREPSDIQKEALQSLILLLENFEERTDNEEFGIAKLYQDLLFASEKSSFTPTVRGKIFQCLGVVAALGKDTFLTQEKQYLQLLRLFAGTVMDQVESITHHLEANILLGCIKGMDKFITAFKDKIPTDHELLEKFYENLEQIIDPRCSIQNDDETVKLKKREFQRVGLDFISNHAEYFKGNLFENHHLWFNDLLTWAKSSSTDSKSGIRAVMKFLECTCSYSEDLQRTGTKKDGVKTFVEFLAGRCKEIMESKESSRTELRVAVKGAGLLAHSCEDPALLESLFMKIMEHIEAIIIELNMPVTEKYSDTPNLVPAYLEAAGNMLLAMKVVDSDAQETFENRLHVVQNLSILLITYYPDLKENYRFFAPDSLLKILEGLYSKYRRYFEPFLDKIIHEGLTHIIASPTQAEADILIETYNQTNAAKTKDALRNARSVYDRLKIRTVKFYTRFWTGLIKEDRTDEFSKAVTTVVYNKVLEWIHRTIDKLDLSLAYVDDEAAADVNLPDPVYDTDAVCVKDFQLFINLVDFFGSFVRYSRQELFSPWIEICLEKSLGSVEKHPLVSGFYRIVALGFEMGRKLNYFQEEGDTLFGISCNFLQMLASRIQEFRDDLLLAVLDVWLAAPNGMIVKNERFLYPTLEAVFRTGRSSYMLASRGFLAMQRWFCIPEFPQEEMEELTNKLLPIWLSYFTAAGYVEEEEKVEVEKLKAHHHSKKSRYRRLQAVLGQQMKETSLKELQLQILEFIGSYGHLIDAGIDDEHHGFSVETKNLKYEVPFQDIKPGIFIDDFLPRLMDKCDRSTDRQTRSASAEVFHTYVIYFLGFHSRYQVKSQVELFRRIFPALVKLGSDTDIVIKQLFNPLALQTVHWCTLKDHSFADATLDIIMDGLVQSEDPSGRDFSSVCLQEYYKWCGQRDNSTQSEKVVKYLVSLSQHAAPQYRQGSVLGFNSIYRSFREDRDQSDKYTLQLLTSYITSLSLSSDMEETSLLVRTIKRAIQHLERVIKKKQDSFNVRIANRPVPSDLKGPLLRDVVDWLLQKSGDCWRCCRFECFRLIRALAPEVAGLSSVEAFIFSFEEENGLDAMVSIAESSLLRVQQSGGGQLGRMLYALESSIEFYAFLKTCDYPVGRLLGRRDSKFLSNLTRFMGELKGFAESGEMAKGEYAKALNIATNIGSFPQLLTSSEMVVDVIESTALIWRRETGGTIVREHEKLVQSWKQLWSQCEPSNFSLELKRRMKNVFQLNLSADDMDVSSVRWIAHIARTDFLATVFEMEELIEMMRSVWTNIEAIVFEKRQGKGWEERGLSNRQRNWVQALFNFLVSLRVQENEVVGRVFDPTIVKQLKAKTTKGEVYQSLFMPSFPLCGSLLEFQTLKGTYSLERVGQLIQRLIAVLKNNPAMRRQCGQTLVEKALEVWNPLALNCSFPVISGLITGLASLHMTKCQDSPELSDWWCGMSMMRNPNLSLKDKSEFIHFLGLFASSGKVDIVEKVFSTIHEELDEALRQALNWNVEKNYIIKILHALINVYEQMPQRYELLRTIVLLVGRASVLAESDGNPCSVLARKKLQKIFTEEKLDYGVHRHILRTIHELVMGDSIDCRKTMAVSKFCLLPLVVIAKERAAKDFYKEYVNDIAKDADLEDPSSIPDWHRKITAINLIEILFVRIWSGGIFASGVDLNNVYVSRLGRQPDPDDSKECARDLIKACTKFKLPSEVRDERLRNLVLQGNQAGCNVIQAGARALQIPLKKALNLVIKFPARNNAHWANVVDCSSEWSFPIVLDPSETDKEVEVDDVTETVLKANSRASRKFGLLSSSLHMEATEYDFTAATTVDESKYYQKIFGGSTSPPVTATTAGARGTGVKLEWSLVNQHPCMLALVESFRNFDAKKGKPGNESIMEEVVLAVKSFLTKSSVHKNIKVFLVGAVVNSKSVFAPYAELIGEAITKLVGESVFGRELNYFVKDVLVMLLEWKNWKPSSDYVREVLEFVLPRIHPLDIRRKDVLGQHLSLLQVIVKDWVVDPILDIPVGSLAQILQADVPKGLEICKHVLLGGRLPCSINPLPGSLDLKKLISTAGKTFSGGSKVAYSLAAEVIGLAFKTLGELNETGTIDGAEKFLCDGFLDKVKGSPQAFFRILTNVQQYYPRIIKGYRGIIFQFLKDKNVGVDALRILPTILKNEARIDAADGNPSSPLYEFYKDIEGRGLFLRPCRTEEEIESAVEILESFVGELKEEAKVCTLIEWAENAQASSNSQLRVRYASVVSKLYFAFPDAVEAAKVLSRKVSGLFVNLYEDEDEAMQKVVSDFWEESLKRFTDTPTLLLELLEILGAEKNAVHIAIDLVMKRSSLSPDYNKIMFEKLDECVFQKYDVDTSWRMRNLTFQPLYAESFSSPKIFSKLPRAFQATLMSQRQTTGKLGMNLLRATLEKGLFTPTAPGNYTQGSLYSSLGSQNSFNSKRFYGSFEEGQNIAAEEESASPLAQLRRRFYAQPNQPGYFAGRQMRREDAELERKMDAVQTKRIDVKLLRSYRIGDLPDVMIKHSEFLKMISAMTKVDEELGRAFMVKVFTSILHEVEVKDSRKATKLHRHATKTFNELLGTHGAALSPQFAASLIEITVTNGGAISVRPSLVSEVSRRFELQKLGILKFEGILEGDGSGGEKDAKRTRVTLGGEDSAEADILLRLAELYKDIEDFDSIPNIFRMAANKSTGASELYQKGCQALQYEGQKRWDEALEVYTGLYKDEIEREDRLDQRRLQFWQDSVQKCLMKLSRWEDLFEATDTYAKTLGDESNIFDSIEYLDTILPCQLGAAAQILMRDQSPPDDEPDILEKVRTFIGRLGAVENLWEILLTDSVDLPVISAVVEHESGLTLSYLDKSWNGSLETFRVFEKISKPKKERELLKLQRASALADYMYWSRGIRHDDVDASSGRIVAKWKHCGRPALASLFNADVLVAQKDHFLTKMGMFLDGQMLDSKDQLIMELAEINCEQYLWLAELGVKNSNSEIGWSAFKKAKEVCSGLGQSFKVEWHRIFSKYLLQFTEGDDWEKLWGSSWKSLRKFEDSDAESVMEIQCALLKGLVIKMEDVRMTEEARVRQALRIDPSTNLVTHITQLVGEVAESVTARLDPLCQPSGISMQLYNLLNVVKRKCGSVLQEDEARNYDQFMLTSLLRALQLEDPEALHLLPTTFQAVEKHPEFNQAFKHGVEAVPSWMFLPWLDQTTVYHLHSSSVALRETLGVVIDRIFVDYPQAFQLQYKDLIKRSEFRNLCTLYAEALHAVTLPWILFKKYFPKNPGGVLAMVDLLKSFREKASEVQSKSQFYGELHQAYLNKVNPKVEETQRNLNQLLDPESGSNAVDDPALNSEADSFWLQLWTAQKAVVKGLAGDKPETVQRAWKLSRLSPWLEKFRSSDFEDVIEVPGLYSKFEKPRLHLFPRIVSFFPTVLQLPSLNQPIRLIIMCDNGKDIPYLLKHGDDLRQDKRIQQFFSVTNEIFQNDPQCHERRLRLRTYSVIPLDAEFGLIEWISETVSLKGLLVNSTDLQTNYNALIRSWSDWMNTSFKRRPHDDPYHINAQVLGRNEAVKKFSEYEAKLPQMLLRDHVLEGCYSVEEFFIIRQKMIRSYASMSIVHWLLGIGDRHLENSLVLMKTGEFLGIDFGRAFGTTIFVQSVPELVPFRLTPQLQNFLLPYGCNGLLKETMVCCLRPLKKSSELLGSVLDVFVREPVTDWLRYRRKNSSDDVDGDRHVANWDPTKTMKKKLSGVNPLRIILQEIQLMNPKLISAYTKILKDGWEDSFEESSLSDEKCVEVLINVAAKKNILARIYAGWAPWV